MGDGGGTVVVGGSAVAVGGSAVAVGGSAVAVGGSAVAVGGSAVAVGGSAVAVGGSVGLGMGKVVGVLLGRAVASWLGCTAIAMGVIVCRLPLGDGEERKKSCSIQPKAMPVIKVSRISTKLVLCLFDIGHISHRFLGI